MMKRSERFSMLNQSAFLRILGAVLLLMSVVGDMGPAVVADDPARNTPSTDRAPFSAEATPTTEDVVEESAPQSRAVSGVFDPPTTGYMGTGYQSNHQAIDVWTAQTSCTGAACNPLPGNEVRAAYDGTIYGIYRSDHSNNWGVSDPWPKSAVAVKHTGVPGYGILYTMYLHMANNSTNESYVNANLSVGDQVTKGVTVLGRQGNWQYTSANDVITHLHFIVVATNCCSLPRDQRNPFDFLGFTVARGDPFPPSSCLAESPHPYSDNYNQTWTLTNPDSGASATRIHFSRLETEAGYDYVYVRDGNGNEISRFNGTYSSGVWSAAVPGRTVQVQLRTDYSVTKWGFCVDRIETTTIAQTAPAAPSNLQATPLDSTRIQLTWNDNSNNETGFKIRDGVIDVATLGPNVTSYIVTGMAPNTYRCFSICAFNSAGNSAWTPWACATTPPSGSGCNNDPYEPNNNRDQAREAGQGQTYQGYICPAGDEDWFRIGVILGDRIRIRLTSVPRDYDIYLYNYNGTLLAASTNGSTYDELIEWTASNLGSSANVYLRIFGYNGAFHGTDPYDLRWEKIGSSSTNLALGRPANATSQESSNYTPGRAVDGSMSTRWSSMISSSLGDQWWWVDLGSARTFNQVVIKWENAYAARYAVCWWSDGDTSRWGYWYDLASRQDVTHNIGSRTARYVGIYMIQRAPRMNNYSSWEVEVYNR